jgi:hypothetical protein
MTMRMPSTTVILLNGAVALVAVASIVTMGRSIIGADRQASCRERYTNAVQWSLQGQSGDLLTPTELQARLGSTDWGLLDRVHVVKANNPQGAALEIDLLDPANKGGRETAAAGPAGAGFEWAPQLIDGPRAGCASYSLFLDPNFSFAGGGRLPGIFGGRASEDREAPDAFSTRLAWNADGMLEIFGHMPGLASTRGVTNELGETPLPRGRWIAVDQEVVLNTPGRRDGVLRVWLDGRLSLESRSLSFRADKDSAIRGILAETAYARQPASGDGSGRVAIAPFEFRW